MQVPQEAELYRLKRQLSSETLNPPDVNLEKKHEFVHQSSQSGAR